jgi:hypothetical protein
MFKYSKITGDKQQYRTILSQIHADAIQNKVEVAFMTIQQYQSLPGRENQIPPALIEPQRPEPGNRMTDYKFDKEEFNKRDGAAKSIRAALLECMREDDIKSIKHHVTGMRDISCIQILQQLSENLLNYSTAEVREIINRLNNGIEFDVDRGIRVYIGELKELFSILHDNRNTVSEKQDVKT